MGIRRRVRILTLLPLIQTSLRDLSLLSTRWKSILDPLLSNPISSSNILKSVPLINGVNVINHGLGRALQGWVITDVTAAAVVFRSAPLNSLTLTLTSNASTVVDILVF